MKDVKRSVLLRGCGGMMGGYEMLQYGLLLVKMWR
jgi:hypothetical protein